MRLKANHIRTIDGDTAYIAIKLRLSNVDAAELSEYGGKSQRLKLRKWLREHDNFDVQITGGVDQYGRLLGIAYPVDGVNPYVLPE